MAVLFVAYTFSFADRIILSLLIQPIKQDLGLSDTKISLLHGFAFAIFYTIMGIPIARADRYSRQHRASPCGATAVCGLVNGYWQHSLPVLGLVLVRPLSYSMIADLFKPEKLGRAAFILPGHSLAPGSLIGGTVVQAITSSPELTLPVVGTLRSWQAAFFVVGVPGLLVAALMFTVREPIRRLKSNVTVPMSEVFLCP